MLLEFKYKVNDSLAQLAKSEIINWSINNDINGLVDEADINAKQLKHCSLWLCCERFEENNNTFYRNPCGIVARNQITAIQIYDEKYNVNSGTIKCAIEDRCDNLKIYIND